MHYILNNHNRSLLDKLNRNSVTVEVKGNASWADDAIRKTPYTRHTFPPWNIIMMGSS